MAARTVTVAGFTFRLGPWTITTRGAGLINIEGPDNNNTARMQGVNAVGEALSASRAKKYKMYSGGGFNYHVSTPAGMDLSAASSQVTREEIATGIFMPAGTGDYDQPATDLATVQGLTYA